MRSTYLTVLISVCGIFVVFATMVNWVVDPMRYYHKPWFDIGYSDQQRFANPGLARTADYDTVIIGTSHTETFTRAETDRQLGTRMINLSMSGSLIKEQRMLLDVVLKAGKVKRVIWEINYPSFSLGNIISQPESFPFFFYQTGIETHFQYLMSWDTLLESFRGISGNRVRNLDQLHRWDLDFEFNEERVLQDWESLRSRWNDELRAVWKIYEVSDAELSELVEQQVIDLARSHPTIQFDFLFLPSSMLNYASDFQISEGQHKKRMLLRREIARKAEGVENIQLWDFQLEEWMSYDLAHYKDLDHFDQQIVEAILSEISDGKSRSSAVQLEQETELLELSILVYTSQFCNLNTQNCQAELLKNLDTFRRNAR